MTMTCPKCHGEMRHYERSGVTLDQCAECRGIFLDRGELDRILDAENNWRGRQPAQAAPPPPPQAGYAQQPGYAQPHMYGGHGHGYGRHGHRKHKRRGSFFEELFD
jgi:uncharacterized protein